MQIINPKISIIIPVYNVEQHLARCIDSILAQTFTDFELLLIDDGSKDNSGKICDEYEKKDNRIRVFHKENGGVSSARNVGLDNVVGEWICFCDSDDWVDNNWLQGFMDLENEDLIVEGYYYEKENMHKVANSLVCESVNTSECVEYLYQKQNTGFLWCRAFRKKIIETFGIKFNERFKIREDEDFILRYMQYINYVQLSNVIAYHYNVPNILKYKNCGIIASLDCTISIINSLFTILNKSEYKNKLALEIDSLLKGSVLLLIKNKKDGWYYLKEYNYYRKQSRTCPKSLKLKLLHLLQLLLVFLERIANFIINKK